MPLGRTAWRRPIADRFRRTALRSVHWCVRNNIEPNWVSYASIVASALAGLCFWQSGRIAELLLIAVAFCYLRLWLNMLDGMVALAAGKACRTGEIANELPDRISDVIIFVGVAHSGLCAPLAGYWAAILALLVAYVGTLGQAIGVQREFSGWMSKPWRMVVLHLGAWCTLAQIWSTNVATFDSGISLLDGALMVIILGCLQTVGIRLMRIIRIIREQDLATISAK